jgi:hypothetical protein
MRITGKGVIGNGFFAAAGSSIYCTGCRMQNTNAAFWASTGSYVTADGAQASTGGGVCTYGFMANGSSFLSASSGASATGCTMGAYTNGPAMINATASTFSGGSYGAYTDYNGVIFFSNSTITGNATGCFAADGGHIKLVTSTVSGNTTNYDPLLGTVGNYNALISN